MPESVDPSALKYDAQGLVVAIVQDVESHDVVMVGYMSEVTLRQTLEVGQAVFWSRSRQEVWHKGATSGDYIEVLSVATDCDSDALLIQGRLLGGGVCHTGSRSCFVDVVDNQVRLMRAVAPARA
ncbi:MAG: phosphoribosyl-AMP cyclohydrolase [Dehalococcoidia bacterium]|nr:phosphoribosyl-AMP cyclohydrolase [Dehalococcoidia bacterium]